MLDPANDQWLVNEINIRLAYVWVEAIRARCAKRQDQRGRPRPVFRPRLDLNDIVAEYQPRRDYRLYISWPSMVKTDQNRVGLFLDKTQYGLLPMQCAGDKVISRDLLMSKFRPLGWAFLESSDSAKSGASPIKGIEQLVTTYWPLEIANEGAKRGILLGVTHDILMGEDAGQLLTSRQRQSNTRRR